LFLGLGHAPASHTTRTPVRLYVTQLHLFTTPRVTTYRVFSIVGAKDVVFEGDLRGAVICNARWRVAGVILVCSQHEAAWRIC